jgi:hypothetical protein
LLLEPGLPAEIGQPTKAVFTEFGISKGLISEQRMS